MFSDWWPITITPALAGAVVALLFSGLAWWASRRSAKAAEKTVADSIAARKAARIIDVENAASTLISAILEADVAMERLASVTTVDTAGMAATAAIEDRCRLLEDYAPLQQWSAEAMKILEVEGRTQLREASEDELGRRLADLNGRLIHLRRKTAYWLERAEFHTRDFSNRRR
jgi:ribosomal protein L29